MGISNAVVNLFRKIKFLLLVAVCLILVSCASFYLRDRTHSSSEYESAADKFWGHKSLEKTEEKGKPTVVEVTTEMDLQMCPALSPYMKGVVPLTFPPSLSLQEVSKKNPMVENGNYRPENCKSQQKVAILIPHRNREKHLLYLLYHLHPFLQRQQLEYGIFVIHQAGDGKFNRAKLLNVGYLEMLKEKWDCFILHDVDLVPENDFNTYLCDSLPKHLAVSRNTTKYKLLYSGYFGGVTAMSRDQFARVNGFSNSYWGWGAEDDDLRLRVGFSKMALVRPSPEIARYSMIFHTRDTGNEVNGKRMQLLKKASKVWKTDGLNSCTYKLLSVQHEPLYTNITVDIGKPQ
ncbi:beta-1,4-galactosyltransferase 4-like [Pseudophryne corroboree]|uniref:beta-1,4-galactosyltransferase 4-like n=1 Tax=Pseudophryne corroboree TaxID=495146 RepID=UPI003081B467